MCRFPLCWSCASLWRNQLPATGIRTLTRPTKLDVGVSGRVSSVPTRTGPCFKRHKAAHGASALVFCRLIVRLIPPATVLRDAGFLLVQIQWRIFGSYYQGVLILLINGRVLYGMRWWGDMDGDWALCSCKMIQKNSDFLDIIGCHIHKLWVSLYIPMDTMLLLTAITIPVACNKVKETICIAILCI